MSPGTSGHRPLACSNDVYDRLGQLSATLTLLADSFKEHRQEFIKITDEDRRDSAAWRGRTREHLLEMTEKLNGGIAELGRVKLDFAELEPIVKNLEVERIKSHAREQGERRLRKWLMGIIVGAALTIGWLVDEAYKISLLWPWRKH